MAGRPRRGAEQLTGPAGARPDGRCERPAGAADSPDPQSARIWLTAGATARVVDPHLASASRWRGVPSLPARPKRPSRWLPERSRAHRAGSDQIAAGSGGTTSNSIGPIWRCRHPTSWRSPRGPSPRPDRGAEPREHARKLGTDRPPTAGADRSNPESPHVSLVIGGYLSGPPEIPSAVCSFNSRWRGMTRRPLPMISWLAPSRTNSTQPSGSSSNRFTSSRFFTRVRPLPLRSQG